jgi:NADH dehydrogenase FAD-containing subunit
VHSEHNISKASSCRGTRSSGGCAAFRATRNAHFLHTEVAGVDLERRVVHTRGGEDVPFDYLVLATGSETTTSATPSWRRTRSA